MKKFFIVSIAFFFGSFVIAYAAPPRPDGIPLDAYNDPRFVLGFLVVTHYPGVRNDGTGDSTDGINQAIKDAWKYDLAVFFPSGTYIISDTLKAYEWAFWNEDADAVQGPPSPMNDQIHAIVGSTAGARPVIKLSSSASLFSSASSPRPMISYRRFEADNANAIAEVNFNPMGTPPNFLDGKGHLFFDELRGIDFDCNGKAGCIAVLMNGAQGTSIKDVKINATGGYAGVRATAGQDGFTGNIEIIGGQYGFLLTQIKGWLRNIGSYQGGGVIAGARLKNQTVRAIECQCEDPISVVGFEIIKDGGPIVSLDDGDATGRGAITFMDGTIQLNSGGTAFDNASGKSLYIRNVYVSGTNNLIQSASQPLVTGSGSWKRILEYAYTDQRVPSGPYNDNSLTFPTWNIINGNKGKSPEIMKPIVSVSPPNNLINNHIWTALPSFENDAFVNVLDHGATPSYIFNDSKAGNTGNDDRAAIQAAINAASAVGHGRVFLPRGVYHIGGTLILRANTKLFGAAAGVAVIAYHDSWRPTTGEAIMIQTDSDNDATTFLGFVLIQSRNVGGGLTSTGSHAWDRFSHILWQAGRNSMTTNITLAREWHCPRDPINPYKAYQFKGGGGGKHYTTFGFDRSTGHPDFRNVLISGTTEPLSFYGLATEATKFPDRCEPTREGAEHADTNVEITNASNVRIFSMKREGASPSVVIKNSNNIALFNHSQRGPGRASLGGYFQVLGTSNNILARLFTRSLENLPTNTLTMREALNGQPIVTVDWPDNVSLYKHGEVDDTPFNSIGGPPGPTLNLSVSPSNISLGGSATITWSSSGATACTASGGWTGAKPTSGTQSVSPTTTTTYDLTCTGPTGSTSRSVTVSVSAPSFSCNQYTPSSPIPEAFGSPFWVVQNPSQALISVNCPPTGPASLSAGVSTSNVYVYKDVYVHKDGSWQKLTLSGAPAYGGTWYQGTVTAASLPFTNEELTTQRYAVAYVCTYTGSTWKCGCRTSACTGADSGKWSLMPFKK